MSLSLVCCAWCVAVFELELGVLQCLCATQRLVSCAVFVRNANTAHELRGKCLSAWCVACRV